MVRSCIEHASILVASSDTVRVISGALISKIRLIFQLELDFFGVFRENMRIALR